MARETDSGSVRPLGEPRRHPQHQRLPGLIAVALLAAGGTAGFILGLPGDTVRAEAITATTAAAVPTPQVTPLPYQWLEQAPIDNDQDAWAVHAAVEFDDDIYLLVSDDFETPRRRALWRSGDGEQWETLPLDLGPAAQVTDLDVYGQTLLLSGWSGTTPTMWRSQSPAAKDGFNWISMPLASGLDTVGQPIAAWSDLTTIVNPQGRAVTTARVAISLEDRLLSMSRGAGVTSLLQLAELPQVAVAAGRLWMRTVAVDGDETVEMIQIPDTVGVKRGSGNYGTDIPALQAWAMWDSTDGFAFTPRGLPTPLVDDLRPMPFGDSFVATTENDRGRTDLWTLTDVGWEPSDWTVPAECGGWENTAADGALLLTISDNFDAICVSEDGATWAVNESPTTAVSSQATIWIEGVREGFLAMALNSMEIAVLTSDDGVGWAVVNSAPEILGSVAYRVGDRLIATARRSGEMQPQPVVVWVGEPTGN